LETVYLETSFVSYLVAEPSRDEVTAQRRDASRRWWELRRTDFRCVVSSAVWNEIVQGDAEEIAKRQLAIAPYPILLSTPVSQELAEVFLAKGLLPRKAQTDASHIAIAAVYSVDYILSWNFRHLVNESIQKRIGLLLETRGLRMPRVCIPESLM